MLLIKAYYIGNLRNLVQRNQKQQGDSGLKKNRANNKITLMCIWRLHSWMSFKFYNKIALWFEEQKVSVNEQTLASCGLELSKNCPLIHT